MSEERCQHTSYNARERDRKSDVFMHVAINGGVLPPVCVRIDQGSSTIRSSVFALHFDPVLDMLIGY